MFSYFILYAHTPTTTAATITTTTTTTTMTQNIYFIQKIYTQRMNKKFRTL